MAFARSPTVSGPSSFGQTPQTSLFGAPGSAFGQPQQQQQQQQKPSLFGTPSTNAFGSTQPSLFGTPAGTSPFGSMSTPGFGQTPGASSTPSLFGTPSSSPGFSLTGQGTPSPFGASQPSTGTPSLFGSGTPSLFGAPAPAFGNTGASAPSLFGSSTPASPFGTFGTPAPSAFGQPAGQQQQQQLQQQQAQLLQTLMAPAAAPGAPGQPQADVNSIVEAYNAAACGLPGPGDSRASQFCYAFLSVTHPMGRFRPPGVPDPVWNEAMAKLSAQPAELRAVLWPEIVWGNAGLLRRHDAQEQALREDQGRVEGMEDHVGQLKAHLELLVASRANQVRQQQQRLQQRLLRIMHIVEMLQLKGSSAPLSLSELALVDRLKSLIQVLKGSSELPRRVEAVVAAAQMQEQDSLSLVGADGTLDASSSGQLFRVIASQSDAIAKLVSTAKADSQAVAIMSGERKALARR